MIDKEIIKALECCGNIVDSTCKGCVYHETYNASCVVRLMRDALDLINRQQAEIDRYKGVIKILEKDVAAARNEGVKELAHQLIDKAEKGIVWACDVVDLCHDLTNVLPKEGTDI